MIKLKRRVWPSRFYRSYRCWRSQFGVFASLRAAWIISR